MEKIKNKQSVFEEPKIEVIRFTEKDIITTSGGEEIPEEGEFIPAQVDKQITPRGCSEKF